MSSPQLENGYTPIANEILEALAQVQLSGYQWRIIMVIWRHTYGYKKKEDWLSHSQITNKTNILKPHITRSIKDLVAKNIVTKNGNKIGFNKDYQQYRELPKSVTVPKLVTNGTKIGNKSVPKLVPTKERNKINKRKRDYVVELPKSVTKELWQEFKEHRNRKKASMTNYAEYLMGQKLLKFEKDGFDPIDLINKTITKGWQDINPEWVYKGQSVNNKNFGSCPQCRRPNIELTEKGVCRECSQKKT